MPRRNDIAKILIIGSGPILRSMIVVAGLLLGAMQRVNACVFELKSVRVTPSFQIFVEHSERPVRGIQVVVYREDVHGETRGKPLIQLMTDEHGLAEIHHLRDGRYRVATEGPGGGDALHAIVGSGRSETQSRVVFAWPVQTKIVNTTRLTGRLLNSNEWTPFEKTVSGANLELWKAGSQVPIATATSDPDGQFQFRESESGVYILRIKAKSGPAGEVALELQPAHAEWSDYLTLHLLETSCGLSYRQCSSAPSIGIASHSLRFVSPRDVPFNRAGYRVQDSRQRIVAQGETDDQGTAVLPQDVSGDVNIKLGRMEIAVDQPIHVSNSVNSPSQVLTVQFDGVCSRLSSEVHGTAQ